MELDRYFTRIYFAVVIGGVIMYMMLTISKDVWTDETYTFALINHGFADIWRLTAADVHPPLYYFLLKLFLQLFGYSLTAAKVFSIIPYGLLIAIGGFQLRKLFCAKTSVLFMILFLLFPFSMRYAVEVRMYSLAAFFVFMNALYAYRSWKKQKLSDWIIFAIFGAGAAYTHYYAMVSVGILYGLLFLHVFRSNRRLLKYWSLSVLLLLVMYLPWGKCFITQLIYKVNHEYWIEPINLEIVIDYVCRLFGSSGIFAYVVFSGGCYTAALVYILWKKDRKDILIAVSSLAVPVCTIGIGIAASVLIRPVFIIRYVVPAVPLLVFFMAYVVGRMEKKILAAVILTVSLVGGGSAFARNLYTEYEMRECTCMFEEEYDFVDAYYVNDDVSEHIPHVISYYRPMKKVYTVTDLSCDAELYPNIVGASDFCAQRNEHMILIVAVRGEIPKEFLDRYDLQYIGNVREECHTADAYLLTLK